MSDKEKLELIVSQGGCLGISCPKCPIYQDCDSESGIVEIAKKKLKEAKE